MNLYQRIERNTVFISLRRYMLKDWVILSIVLLIYLLFCSKFLDGYVVDWEETNNLAIIHESISSGFKSTIAHFNFHLFSLRIPLTTVNCYMGAIECYLYLPFICLFGMNYYAIRLTAILIGALIVFFSYLFIKEIFGKYTAVIACVLLVFQPNFIIFNTKANSDTPVNLFFASSLYLFAKWLAGGKTIYLYLLGLCLGVGLWTKIVFVWVILGLLLSYLILFRNTRIPSRKETCILLLMFLAGVSPQIYANITDNGETISLIISSLWNTTSSGVNNFDIIHNILFRVNEFAVTFGGANFDNASVVAVVNATNTWVYLFFIIVLLFNMFIIVKSDMAQMRTGAIFILGMFSVLFFGLTFTVFSFRPQHLFALTPLPQIMTALFFTGVLSFFKTQRTKFYSSLLMMCGFVVLLSHHARILYAVKNNPIACKVENSGKADIFTDYLLVRGIKTIYTLNRHCMHQKITYLSGNRVLCRELDNFDKETLKKIPRLFYVLAFESENVANYFAEVPARYIQFRAMINSGRCAVLHEHVVRDQLNRVIYKLYLVRREYD